ncbi:MAG TPA: hypothetical protein VGL38_07195 [bacterium]
MRFSFKLLIILLFAAAARAQVWPDGAVCNPEAGLPCSRAGQLRVKLAGALMRSEHWRDSRSRFGMEIGLGYGIGLSLESSTRDLRGFGAFEKGLQDTRLGLSLWPSFSPRLAAGINGFLSLPTGFRKSQLYHDTELDTTFRMPALSLKQSAGELYTGAVWTLGPVADLHLFGGYFCTSDRTGQAFRWGLGTTLSPFGETCRAELNYSRSITRTGIFPNTETLEAALPFETGWGVTLSPGMWADLDDEPMYGVSLGLHFETTIPGIETVKPPRVIISPPRLAGVVLVASPVTDIVLADGRELWQSIQDGVRPTFDDVKPLSTLDIPGLPFTDRTEETVRQTVRALAQSHPEADWLLITRVIREDVSRQNNSSLPLVVSRPLWAAQCKLKVLLIDLRGEKTRNSEIIEGRASKKDFPQLAVLSPSDDAVLSMKASRQLTFEAYRNAGHQIALQLLGEK